MPTDIHKALSSLSPVERKKLLVKIDCEFGYLQQRGGPSPEDLLQETYVRLLSGRRRWPDDVDPVVCLWQCVRSLAHHEYRSIRCKVELAFVEFDEDAEPEASDFSEPAWLVSQEEVAAFRASLADDPRLQILLDGKLLGHTQRQIAAQLQLCDASVTRLNRKLQSRCKQFFGYE